MIATHFYLFYITHTHTHIDRGTLTPTRTLRGPLILSGLGLLYRTEPVTGTVGYVGVVPQATIKSPNIYLNGRTRMEKSQRERGREREREIPEQFSLAN